MATLTLSQLSTFNDDQEAAHNEKALLQIGGINSLEKGLKTNFKTGLSGDESFFDERRKVYGANEFPEAQSDTWLQMFLESFEDTTLLILIVAAVVSLGIGIYEDPAKGWIEGGAILFAVLLVAVVTASNNYNKEMQFKKLNAVKDDITVGVIRGGQSMELSIKKLVVGDIVRLNAGDKVPADGLLINGSDVACNESALTGESDECKKSSLPTREGGDPFLISGATLSSGYCTMLVTAVGENSRWGRTRAKLTAETGETPLQEKLNVLAGQIGMLGMAAAAATFIALVVMWFSHPDLRPAHVTLVEYLLKAFIMAVTIVVVAVPEGLPLAVTLSLAYSTQKMMLDNNLIRVLAACETMGNATNICSDKTGTLTQNRMTVVEAWAGGRHFTSGPPGASDVSAAFSKVIIEGISVNSTAVLLTSSSGVTVSGSSTEGALLLMVNNGYGADYSQTRADNFNESFGDKLFTFTSARKCMSALVMNSKRSISGRIYTKGASEVLLAKCASYLNLQGKEVPLTAAVRKEVAKTIQLMAGNALRTVALVHRDVTRVTGRENAFEIESGDFTLDMIVGIKDPLRPEVIDAVRTCQAAGIMVRMVTGDNIDTAKAIARECGILTEGGAAMEGPEFRKLTPAQVDAVLPTLQVLARSSPTDKHTLVTRLNGHNLPTTREEWEEAHPDESWAKSRDRLLPGYAEEWQRTRQYGEVVGVTGDGTNDGPALKAADVGLSMGLSGTDVAKEASDIVIMDDNFASIVKAVMWGRSVFDNIRKFLQFQLTVNVVALTLTFVSAFTGHEPPLNAVMMLWVNMIMDTMGALALGTEPPSLALLDRRPYKRNASLISNTMIRNISVQFFYQMGLLAYLLFLGFTDFNVAEGSRAHFTVIFNAFVFCQIFNEINARSIGNTMNVFHGLSQNPLFLGILAFTVAAQYLLVQFGGEFVRTVALNQDQWLKCVLLGSLSLPIGGLMRLIPVRDRESDFAEVSSLVTAAVASRTTEKSQAIERVHHEESSGDLSFYIWLLTVCTLPVVTYSVFQSSWGVHASAFIAYFK